MKKLALFNGFLVKVEEASHLQIQEALIKD